MICIKPYVELLEVYQIPVIRFLSVLQEISLGIIGNLACHEISREHIASVNGLVGAIVEQLFLDDVPCLCEACR